MKKFLGFLPALVLVLVLMLCVSSAAAAEEETGTAGTAAADSSGYDSESDWQHAAFIDGANGWQQTDGTWYFYRDGFRLTGWQKIGGIWYYLDADARGAMLVGWQYIDGVQYYFRSSGAMATGWQRIYNEDLGEYKWYYFRAGGSQAAGWQQIGGVWYYMNRGSIPTENYMLTGWQQIGGKWYYLKSNGAMAVGWVRLYSEELGDDAWYYFSSSGAQAAGWQSVGSSWYYLKKGTSPTGNYMLTGLQQIGGKWYYFKSSGAMATGWVQMTPAWNYGESLWYYFKANGTLATGWQQIGGKWYCFGTDEDMDPTYCYMFSSGVAYSGSTAYLLGSSGAMFTTVGWHSVHSENEDTDAWYYVLNSSGKLAVGWQKIGSSWYYFYEYGEMAADTSVQINGRLYLFGSSGAWIQQTGWSKLTVGTTDCWFYSENGSTLVTGQKVIDGTAYHFDDTGRLDSRTAPILDSSAAA